MEEDQILQIQTVHNQKTIKREIIGTMVCGTVWHIQKKQEKGL